MASLNALGNSLNDGRGDASRYISIVNRSNDQNTPTADNLHVEQRAVVQLCNNTSHGRCQGSFAGQFFAGFPIGLRPTATA
jgi:hypothetical protein